VRQVSTASQPARHPPGIRVFPTRRGRRTQAAIDAAARTVIARKGILATTIAGIAAEAGRYRAIYGKEA
jgi:AcrR family transcriptional regulator